MAFLVDPFAQTVTDVHAETEVEDEQTYLGHMRKLLSDPFRVEQLALVGIEGGFVAMFLDNFGMLRGDQQRLWRYKDGPGKLAGKALLVAVDPSTGMVAPIRAEAIEQVREGIVWLPEVRIVRIREFIDTEPGRFPQLKLAITYSDAVLDDGAPVPEEPGEAPPAPRLQRWVVTARPDKSVKALCYEIGEDAEATPQMTQALTAADLEELHKDKMPAGLTRLDPADDDPPEVLEYWVPGEAA